MKDYKNPKYNIFKQITVTPSYGKNICNISWVLRDDFLDENYFVDVLKSRDGKTDWYHLSSSKTDAVTGCFIDKNIKIDSLKKSVNVTFSSHNENQIATDLQYNVTHTDIKYYYKLCLYDANDVLITHTKPITIFNNLKMHEFSTLKAMLNNELLLDTWTDFLVYRPLGSKDNNITSTTYNDNLDPLTGDVYATHTDTESFGKTYNGGYAKPFKTKFILNATQNKQVDMDGGQGTLTQNIIQFNGLSYPRLFKGDLLVNPLTDDRYLFQAHEQEFFFKGNVPFKFSGTMKLLDRNEIEYKVH